MGIKKQYKARIMDEGNPYICPDCGEAYGNLVSFQIGECSMYCEDCGALYRFKYVVTDVKVKGN